MIKALDNTGRELLIGDVVELMDGTTTRVSNIGQIMGFEQPEVVHLEDGRFLYPKQPYVSFEAPDGGIFEARKLNGEPATAVEALHDTLARDLIKRLLEATSGLPPCHYPQCQTCRGRRETIAEARRFVDHDHADDRVG